MLAFQLEGTWHNNIPTTVGLQEWSRVLMSFLGLLVFLLIFMVGLEAHRTTWTRHGSSVRTAIRQKHSVQDVSSGYALISRYIVHFKCIIMSFWVVNFPEADYSFDFQLISWASPLINVMDNCQSQSQRNMADCSGDVELLHLLSRTFLNLDHLMFFVLSSCV